MRRARAIDLATTALFVLALLAPSIDHVLRPPEARSVRRENRDPAPPPAPITDLASLSNFPPACESWFSDRLGGRDLLLRQWQRTAWLGLGVHPTAILRGRDGCDFYSYGRTPDTDRGAFPFTTSHLEAVTRSLEAQRDRCRRLGAEFVCVFVPNKEAVYADKWPESHVRVGPTRLEQLTAWLEAHSDVHVLDLRAALTLERALDRPELDDCVYYPLGSHVTWRGGFAAWNAIAQELGTLFPSVRPVSREDYTLLESLTAEHDSLWDNSYVGDLVHQRTWWMAPDPGAESVLEHDAGASVTTSRRDDPALPTALFVHDSFGPWMLPFAARSFSRLVSLRQARVPREQIERHRPAVVIHEATERNLEWDLGEPVQDVVRVGGAQFRAYAPCFGPADLSGEPVLVAGGGVTLLPTEAGLWIEQKVGDAVVELPPVKLDAGADLALHVRITAPVDATLRLYYLTHAEPRYGRARVLALDLPRGDNDLYLRLLVPELTGAVRMHLTGPGAYLLRVFEMRVAR